jgi:2-polyprenyl-3-methyl-5-hydroxy-6-metoxy-1,4-benzoquinol methylase
MHSFRRSETADTSPDGRRRRGYESERSDVQALVPLTASRILDLGCSTGALGAALKRRNGAYVVGVEIDAEYARQAETRLDRVLLADAEELLSGSVPEQGFDCLIGADVFEHLRDPWQTLSRARDLLAPDATIVISLPNVLHWVGLWRVIAGGRWPRDEVGVFDRTHLRWFTMLDAIELVESAGLRLETITPNYPGRGLVLTVTRLLGHAGLRRFLAVQWLVVASKS